MSKPKLIIRIVTLPLWLPFWLVAFVGYAIFFYGMALFDWLLHGDMTWQRAKERNL